MFHCLPNVMETSGLTFEHFSLILPYKTWWKPRFPMDWRPLVEGYIANIGISLDVFEFWRFGWFFPFFKKFGFWLFLVHPSVVLSGHLKVFSPPLPEVRCPIFLKIQNPWGKSNGKKWSHIWTFLFESGCLTKHGGNHASWWIRYLWSTGILLILAYL